MNKGDSGFSIVVVDDEADILRSYRLLLKRAGLSAVRCFQSGREGLAYVCQERARLILLDLSLRNESGQEYLAHFQEEAPQIPVIIITGNQELETAVSCMRAGAYDYLVKPIDENRLITTVMRALEWHGVEEENRRLKERLLEGKPRIGEPFKALVTQHAQMLNLLAYAEVVADSPKPVLITGESGTGKELLAHAIHHAGSRADRPWITVNVAGLEDDVFSDTLFGHVRGAYTGAQTARAGLIEKAGDGTLVLDEMGELSLPCQIKLLRLLQEDEYYALGSDSPQRSKARIIAVTNLDLDQRVREGLFRMDLYYRLRVHHLVILPLRSRPDDIPLLLKHFMCKAAATLNVEEPTLGDGVVELLVSMAFPGNVRELETLLFDAVTRYHNVGTIPFEYFSAVASRAGELMDGRSVQVIRDYRQPVEGTKNDYTGWSMLPTLQQSRALLIEEALQRTGGNQAAAARMLGISPQALSKHLHKK